jgi:hypothetical protein
MNATEIVTDAEVTARKIEMAVATTVVGRLRMSTGSTDGSGSFLVWRDGRKYRVTVEDLGEFE